MLLTEKYMKRNMKIFFWLPVGERTFNNGEVSREFKGSGYILLLTVVVDKWYLFLSSFNYTLYIHIAYNVYIIYSVSNSILYPYLHICVIEFMIF